MVPTPRSCLMFRHTNPAGCLAVAAGVAAPHRRSDRRQPAGPNHSAGGAPIPRQPPPQISVTLPCSSTTAMSIPAARVRAIIFFARPIVARVLGTTATCRPPDGRPIS